jgi:hypothetical protein
MRLRCKFSLVCFFLFLVYVYCAGVNKYLYMHFSKERSFFCLGSSSVVSTRKQFPELTDGYRSTGTGLLFYRFWCQLLKGCGQLMILCDRFSNYVTTPFRLHRLHDIECEGDTDRSICQTEVLLQFCVLRWYMDKSYTSIMTLQQLKWLFIVKI